MTAYEQIIHDKVVAVRTRQLGLLYRVLPDPDLIRITHKNALYPDIIVIDNNNVLFIEEVATENSITEHERDTRWLGYTKLGYPFNLIVPKSKIVRAEQLIKGFNINKLFSYELNEVDIKFRQLMNNMNIM